MALKRVSIGSLVNVIMYDDGDYNNAIETDGTIEAEGITVGTLPTKSVLADADLLLIRDSANSFALTTCTVGDLKSFLYDLYDVPFKGSVSLVGGASVTLESEVIPP